MNHSLPGRQFLFSNHNDVFNDRVHLYVRDNGVIWLPATISTKTFVQGELQEPFMTFTYDEAQSLMHQLWVLGFRPNNGEGTNSHVAALTHHLADMRRLAFKVLDIND